jgi:hypothetical protein
MSCLNFSPFRSTISLDEFKMVTTPPEDLFSHNPTWNIAAVIELSLERLLDEGYTVIELLAREILIPEQLRRTGAMLVNVKRTPSTLGLDGSELGTIRIRIDAGVVFDNHERAIELLGLAPPPEPTPTETAPTRPFEPGEWVKVASDSHACPDLGLKKGVAYRIRGVIPPGCVDGLSDRWSIVLYNNEGPIQYNLWDAARFMLVRS